MEGDDFNTSSPSLKKESFLGYPIMLSREPDYTLQALLLSSSSRLMKSAIYLVWRLELLSVSWRKREIYKVQGVPCGSIGSTSSQMRSRRSPSIADSTSPGNVKD
jgi:hypothetical protein